MRDLMSARCLGRAAAGVPALALAVLFLAPEAARAADPLGYPARGRFGVEVQRMTPELRAHFGAPADRGVLVARVAPDGPAARAGVEVGDVLVAADGKPLASPLDLLTLASRAPAGRELSLELVRDREARRVALAPAGEPVPLANPDDWRDLADALRRAVDEGSRELLRKLEELEQRLERLEQEDTAPGQERT
jgi:membrane-associated protease RseP (regulator of RpoE activity)